MAKDQLLKDKVSVCKFLICEINSNCNSILRPTDKNGVTMEIKKEYSWTSTFEPRVPCFHYAGWSHSVPAFLSDRLYFQWTTH